MNKVLLYFTLFSSILLFSCIDEQKNKNTNKTALKKRKNKSYKVEHKLNYDTTTIENGDSISLKISLKINDSIASGDIIFSYDDTTELKDYNPKKSYLTTGQPLWFMGGPGVHIVRGKTRISLPDTTYWEKWTFEYEMLD